MVYVRFILIGILPLVVMYYITVVAHCFNIAKLPDTEEIEIKKALIPLYYWFKLLKTNKKDEKVLRRRRSKE